MRRVAVSYVCAGLLILAETRFASAETVPPAGGLDARVREVLYEAHEVYRIEGQVGIALDLEFEPGETFVGLASGDRNALEFSAQGSHLFLKPKAAPVTTNLTILTDRRVYRVFYVVGSTRETPATPVPFAVKFAYPSKERPSEASSHPTPPPAVTMPASRRYEFCGPAALKPVRVFDDDVRTTILFGPHQPWPAVFAVEADGSESLVNFTATPEGLVIHRTAAEFRLRRGRLVGCLRARPARDGKLGEVLP